MARGRRPGNQDTRAEILLAARDSFLADGYDRTTVRSVARGAGVDPSLVHHYFGDKASLFVAVMHWSRDPGDIRAQVAHSGRPKGAELVGAFLDIWEGPASAGPPGSSFVALVQAASSTSEIADAVREFLSERVWGGEGTKPDAAWEPALVSAQLSGLGWARYVLRVEPLASAPPAEVAARVGPVIDQLLDMMLE